MDKEKTVTYHEEKGLSMSDVEALLYGRARLDIAAEALQKVDRSFDFLRDFSKDKIIYGINTGFGPMAQYRVDDAALEQLQYNIIRSHSTGAGRPLEPLCVRAALLVRLATFLQGRSGVHRDLPLLLLEFLRRDICPMIPEHGSVGASGDLVQLAHMALALIGEGEVYHRGLLRPTRDVFEEEEGLQPLKLRLREGLAATNGTSVMTGIGLVNLIEARRLTGWAVAASVMMNEVAASYDDLMSPVLNEAKRHPGQRHVAAEMRRWAKGSRALRQREAEMFRPHTEAIFERKVQAYYSLRCVPQVLGPVWDTIERATEVLIDELNSACDNPIVDAETRNVYHGGNFHGDYVSLEMDKLKIAVTKQAMLAERQLNYLCHDRINDGILPPFVNLGVPGLNYGMQAAQFTATSTTAECQTLSNPMYVHSIPNNNDNQDIVSMGTNAALLARRVVENAYQVTAILFMALAQAVDYLKLQPQMAPRTRAVYDAIRRIFPAFTDDKPRYREIEAMVQLLKTTDSEQLKTNN